MENVTEGRRGDVTSGNVSQRPDSETDLTHFEYEALRAERRLQSLGAGAVGFVVGAGVGVLFLLWMGMSDGGLLLRAGVVGGGVFGAFMGFLTAKSRRLSPLFQEWLAPITAALLTQHTLDRYEIVGPGASVGIALGGVFIWAVWQRYYGSGTVIDPARQTVFAHSDESPRLRIVQMLGAGAVALGATTCTVGAASDGAVFVGMSAFFVGVASIVLSQLYVWLRRLGTFVSSEWSKVRQSQ